MSADILKESVQKARCMRSRIAVMGLVALATCGAAAAIPGGLEKKYVGLLFDVINTTP